MKVSKILIAGLVAASCGAFAGSAHATAYVFNMTLSATPDGGGNLPTPGVTYRNRVWDLGPLFTPFNVTSGDTIQANFTFTSAVSIVAGDIFPIGGFWGTNLGYRNGVSSSAFTFSTSSAVSFTGMSGDFTISPTVNTLPLQTLLTEGFNGQVGSFAATLPNTSMSFTGLTFLIDVLSISSQTAPFQFAKLQIADQAAPVPLSGALALLGLGLFGMGGLRRKAKAA